MSEDNKDNASVQLDSKTLMAFESHLRNSLVDSQFFLAADNKDLQSAGDANTTAVDAPKAARLSEQIRDHLVASKAISQEDHDALTKLTSQVK